MNQLRNLRHSRLFILATASIILPILFTLPTIVPPAHGAGLLYVSPVHLASRPLGTLLTYNVKVASMDAFNGWDISVVTNSSLLDPQTIDVMTNNLFQANFSSSPLETISCVDGVGTGCTGGDGPGVAHSSAVSGVPATDGTSGLLFTITYRVTGLGSGLLSVPSGLDTIFNGPSSVSHSDSPGVYGTSAFFAVSANPGSLTVVVGSSGTSAISVSSFNSFVGKVNVSASLSSSLLNPPSVGLSNSTFTGTSVSVDLTANSTVTVTLKVAASASTSVGLYSASVTASRGGTTHSVAVSVMVAADFTIGVTSPADFNAGMAGTANITITPIAGFTGTIYLSTSTSPMTGLFPNCPPSVTVIGPSPISMKCSPNSSTPGSYLVNITASSGVSVHSATFVSHVGGFTVSAASLNVSFNNGSSTSDMLTLTSTQNFAGTVSLTSNVAGLTINCPSVTLTANQTGVTSNCIISSGTPGLYSATIAAASGLGTESHSVTVTVHVGDFMISATSPSGIPGRLLTSQITLTSVQNFAGTVALTNSSIPAGLTCNGLTATTVSLTANGTGSSSLSCSSVTSGIFTITIKGVGSPGIDYHSALAVFTLSPDFSINPSASTVNFNIGASGSDIMTITSVGSFHGTVTFQVSSSPTGVTGSCPSISLPTTTSNCTFNSPTTGVYAVTVTATNSTGSPSHATTVTVHVGDFTVSAASLDVSFNTGSSVTDLLTLTSTQNFAGTVTLTSTVAGLTVSCPSVRLNANQTGATSSCTISGSTPGLFSATIAGTASPGTASHSVTMTVHVGDFTIAATSSVSFNSGAKGSVITLTLTSTQNFAGTVNLAPAVSLSTGLTIACPASATLTANGTVTYACTLTSSTPGVYAVTLTGNAATGTAFRQAHSTVHVGDFILTVIGADFNVGQTDTTVVVSLKGIFDYAGTVALTETTSSSSLTMTCRTTSVNLSANGTGTSSCSLSSNSAGTYGVTFGSSGLPGSASHSAIATVHVGEFKILVSNTSLTAGQTGVFLPVAVVSTFNFAGSVTLTGTSTSSSITVSCPAAPVTVSANATTTVQCALSSSVAGSYGVSIAGTGTPGSASITPGAGAIVLVSPAQSTAGQPLNNTTIAVIVGVIAVVILLAAFLLLRRRRLTDVS